MNCWTESGWIFELFLVVDFFTTEIINQFCKFTNEKRWTYFRFVNDYEVSA